MQSEIGRDSTGRQIDSVMGDSLKQEERKKEKDRNRKSNYLKDFPTEKFRTF